MNVNSRPLAPKINQWLHQATHVLKSGGVTSARLDAELLLAHALGKDRPWILAHSDDTLTTQQANQASLMIQKRADRVPLAYLTERREFYGREFVINQHVLVPRPETEDMIEEFLKLPLRDDATVIDVGCGSGCIAITAKLERPQLHVIAVDISTEATDIALVNARHLKADIQINHSDLLHHIGGKFDCVLANLPYVDREWNRSPETDHEPALALFADNHGLALIDKLIGMVPQHLHRGGYLLLEADPEQHAHIIERALALGLHYANTTGYIVTLQQI